MNWKRKMKKILFMTWAAIIFFLAIGGCAEKFIITQPRPVYIGPSELTTPSDLWPLDAVTILIDTLPEDTKVILCKNLGMKGVGDLAELSEIAKSILINAFSSRSIEINDSADKQLTISINKAFCEGIAFGWKTITVLKVRTGDGLLREYVGYRKLFNMYQSSRALELAVRNSVIEMLKSPEINNYLKN
jgi:hypothetical protein